MIVVDASALVAASTDEGAVGEAARARCADEELAAPELVYLEVMSVMRKDVRRQHLTTYQAAGVLSDLLRLPLERVPHVGLLPRIWELHANLSSYDASYVALAEIQTTILVTTDARLARAPGPKCEIEVLADA